MEWFPLAVVVTTLALGWLALTSLLLFTCKVKEQSSHEMDMRTKLPDFPSCQEARRQRARIAAQSELANREGGVAMLLARCWWQLAV